MKKKIFSTILTLSFVSFLAIPAVLPATVNAQDPDFGIGDSGDFKGNVDLGTDSSLGASIANIINIVLGFLGIVAVVIILAGGFKWMTAGGNEDKVGEAKQMIIQGIIGLVIVFAAWAIGSFVVDELAGATGATSSTP